MTDHREIELLIPWYVTGSLGERDMARVQRHLTQCADCRTLTDDELRLARQLHQTGDDRRLAALANDMEPHLGALRSRLKPVGRPRQPSRAIPVVLASLVMLAPLAWIGADRPPTNPVGVFEARAASTLSDRPVLQLVFQPDTSQEDRALLLAATGAVIAGPSRQGVYRVALETARPDDLLRRVRAHPIVRWAEIEL